MKVDRDPNRPVKHLEWRVRLLGVGAVLALAGMMLEHGWLVNVAIGVLLLGFGLRFVPGGGQRNADDPDDDEADGSDLDAGSGDEDGDGDRDEAARA